MSDVMRMYSLTLTFCLQAGIPQCEPVWQGPRRSERLLAAQRSTALQMSRQGRQQVLLKARKRAQSMVFCAMPDPEQLPQCRAPKSRQAKSRACLKKTRQAQPVRAGVSRAAAASSKARRSMTLARKRREPKAADADGHMELQGPQPVSQYTSGVTPLSSSRSHSGRLHWQSSMLISLVQIQQLAESQ